MKPICLFTASFVISLLGGFVPIGGAFSIQRTLSLFPFFIAGYVVKDTYYLNRLKLNKLTGGIILLVLLFYIFFDCIFTEDGQNLRMLDNFSRVEQATYCYSKWGNPLMWLCGRFAFLIVASATCVSILSIIPEKRIQFVSEEGKDSLVYYVYHAFVFRLLLRAYPVIGLEYNLLTLFAGAVVVMLIVYLLKHIPIFIKILNPISSFYKK